MGCINFCCHHSQDERPDLSLNQTCVIKPSIYKNVNVTIDENCRVVLLENAEKEQVFLCDPCRGDDD